MMLYLEISSNQPNPWNLGILAMTSFFSGFLEPIYFWNHPGGIQVIKREPRFLHDLGSVAWPSNTWGQHKCTYQILSKQDLTGKQMLGQNFPTCGRAEILQVAQTHTINNDAFAKYRSSNTKD